MQLSVRAGDAGSRLRVEVHWRCWIGRCCPGRYLWYWPVIWRIGCGCTVDAPRSVTACLNSRPLPGTRLGTDDRSALSFSVISSPVIRCPRCTGTFRHRRDTSNRAVGSIATWMATTAVGEPGRVMATDLDPCFAPDDPRIEVRCHDIAAGGSRQGRHLARRSARRGVGRADGIADREFPGREPILPHAARRGQTTATARWPE